MEHLHIFQIIIIAIMFLGCSKVDTEQKNILGAQEIKLTVKESKSGESIYLSKCAPCHGLYGEKNALGKSQVIAGWREEKIKTVLFGYKDGSYGREFKEMMRGQISQLDDEEIELVVEYISKF